MSRPTKLDWVIVGWEKGGKFHVLASDRLADGDVTVEREIEIDREALLRGDVTTQMKPAAGRYEIRARTVRSRPDGRPLVVMAQGDDYADALRNLMSFWTPEGDEAPAIEPARRELEG